MTDIAMNAKRTTEGFALYADGQLIGTLTHTGEIVGNAALSIAAGHLLAAASTLTERLAAVREGYRILLARRAWEAKQNANAKTAERKRLRAQIKVIRNLRSAGQPDWRAVALFNDYMEMTFGDKAIIWRRQIAAACKK